MTEAAAQGLLRKHELVRRALLADIRKRQPHALLPTERDLATAYGVSRATVQKALDRLEDDGIVYRVQGAGTFVAGPMISKTLSLTSFTEDMIARGLRPSSRVLAADEVAAGDIVAGELRIDPDEPVVRLARVRLADDIPICLETAHLPAAKVPGLLGHNMSGSMYEVLQARYHLKVIRAEQVVRVSVLGHGEAILLGTPVGSPALHVHRIGLDERDRPLECTTSVYRGDRYDLRFTVRREHG